MLQDLLYAFRLIRKSPLFSIYVVVPLALGIGLNGTIFLLVDALLLSPLPVKNPHTLVRIAQNIRNIGMRSYFSYEVIPALRTKSTTLSDVIGYEDLNTAMRDAGGARRIRVQIVTGNFFTALGVSALYGRVLTPADEALSGGAPAVVLSYPYWHREFRGDPSVVGKTLILSDHAFTIVGVTPEEFNGIEVETTPDVRIPFTAVTLVSNPNESFRAYQYSLAARLRPGTSVESARAETAGIVHSIMDEGPERVEIQPIATGVSLLRPKFSNALILLIGGVGMLLLMICANAGGLLLARASARSGETGVRLALGASGGRLLRQWLTESLVLTTIGGGLGLGLAILITPLLVGALPTLRDGAANVLTLAVHIHPNARFFGVIFLLCAVCALFAGLPAAFEASRGNLQSPLRGSRASLRQPLRWALVAIQVGFCSFLLAAAGLMVFTFRNLRSLDPGFDRDHIVIFSMDPEMAHYTPQQASSVKSRLLAAVRELPSVQSAAIAAIGMMHGTGMKTTVAPANQSTPRSDFMNTSINFVSPEYFDTMGIPFLEGRNFRADEPASKPEQVIVNHAFVRRFFPTTDAIGQKFGIGADTVVKGDYQIAGVVGDAKYRSLRENIQPTFYHYLDASRAGFPFILHVRTRNRPDAIIQPVRAALNAIDPRLPFYEVRILAEEVDASLWAERLVAWLSILFAAVATALSMLGVYATVSYAVAQSKREIGIRVALGARPMDVVRLFSARPLRFSVLGVLLGMVAFYAANPAFRTILYEVSPADPVAMGAATILVLLTAFVASFVAVSGAFRVDPAVVLRDD